MLNAIPVIGWLISVIVSISLSIPFWICWTICELGKKYFDFLPAKYQSIPFWHCVGLFIIVSILKVMVPTIASFTTNVDNKLKLTK